MHSYLFGTTHSITRNTCGVCPIAMEIGCLSAFNTAFSDLLSRSWLFCRVRFLCRCIRFAPFPPFPDTYRTFRAPTTYPGRVLWFPWCVSRQMLRIKMQEDSQTGCGFSHIIAKVRTRKGRGCGRGFEKNRCPILLPATTSNIPNHHHRTQAPMLSFCSENRSPKTHHTQPTRVDPSASTHDQIAVHQPLHPTITKSRIIALGGGKLTRV